MHQKLTISRGLLPSPYRYHNNVVQVRFAPLLDVVRERGAEECSSTTRITASFVYDGQLKKTITDKVLMNIARNYLIAKSTLARFKELVGFVDYQPLHAGKVQARRITFQEVNQTIWSADEDV